MSKFNFKFMLFRLLLFGAFASLCAVSCGKPIVLAIPKSPKRIAILNLLAAKLIWKFGKSYQKNVIALPNTIDIPRYSDMAGKWPIKIARISATAEQILLTKPDLVILSSFNSIAMRGAISKLGVPNLLLQNFTGFLDYQENVRKIAIAVNAKAQGEELIQAFKIRLNKIQAIARKNRFLNQITALSYHYDSFSGSQTNSNDIIEASGLQNLAVSKKIKGNRRGSQEEILLWNPDVIIIGCLMGRCESKEKKFKNRFPLLKHTKAFKKNLIIAIEDVFLTSIDENMLRATEKLQKRVLTALR